LLILVNFHGAFLNFFSVNRFFNLKNQKSSICIRQSIFFRDRKGRKPMGFLQQFSSFIDRKKAECVLFGALTRKNLPLYAHY